MSTISKIRIELSDWLYNAGVVGFINALKYNGDKIDIYRSYIEIEEEVLIGFETKYFNYLANKYEPFLSWSKLVSIEDVLIDLKSSNELDESHLEVLNNQIDYMKTKLKSNSYTKAYENIEDKDVDLLSISKDMKKIKLKKNQTLEDIKDDINLELEKIKKVIDFIKRDNVKKHLVAKDLIYTVVKEFWSGVAFLDPKKSSLDIYTEFNNYFLKPINDLDLEKGNVKNTKYKCLNCGTSISSLKNAFYLTPLENIGVDGNRKASHFWNMDRDDYICPICNLIYACMPLGFTYLKGKGIFINNNISLEELVNTNKHTLDKSTRLEDLEYSSYFKIATTFEEAQINHFDKEINNIQVVKLDTNKEFTKYTFNMLSEDILKILSKNRSRMSFLMKESIVLFETSNNKVYGNLFVEVLDRINRGENLFSLINLCLMKLIRGQRVSLSGIDILLKLNNQLLEGGKDMDCNISDKKLYRIKCLGNELKFRYEKLKCENKLEGATHILLNALRVKNHLRFLDTVITLYGYVGECIPEDFIDCLKDDEKFQTVGYSFILGLRGLSKKED